MNWLQVQEIEIIAKLDHLPVILILNNIKKPNISDLSDIVLYQI